MTCQWEGFTLASQLQGLGVTTDHKPLLFTEDQLCRDRVLVLLHGLLLSTRCIDPRVSQVVQAKISPHLYFA